MLYFRSPFLGPGLPHKSFLSSWETFRRLEKFFAANIKLINVQWCLTYWTTWLGGGCSPCTDQLLSPLSLSTQGLHQMYQMQCTQCHTSFMIWLIWCITSITNLHPFTVKQAGPARPACQRRTEALGREYCYSWRDLDSLQSGATGTRGYSTCSLTNMGSEYKSKKRWVLVMPAAQVFALANALAICGLYLYVFYRLLPRDTLPYGHNTIEASSGSHQVIYFLEPEYFKVRSYPNTTRCPISPTGQSLRGRWLSYWCISAS